MNWFYWLNTPLLCLCKQTDQRLAIDGGFPYKQSRGNYADVNGAIAAAVRKLFDSRGLDNGLIIQTPRCKSDG